MRKLTIVGPNGRGRYTFDVHAAGCRDLAMPKYRWVEKFDGEFADMAEVVNLIYEDIMYENGDDWNAYRNEFNFLPCCWEENDQGDSNE
jgi:hypothetical protein